MGPGLYSTGGFLPISTNFKNNFHLPQLPFKSGTALFTLPKASIHHFTGRNQVVMDNAGRLHNASTAVANAISTSATPIEGG